MSTRRGQILGVVVLAVGVLVGCSSSGSDHKAAVTTTVVSEGEGEPVGMIVLERGSGETERVVGVDLASGEQHELSDGPGFGPRISPDGERVAFSVASADGKAGRVVVRDSEGDAEELAEGTCPSFTEASALLVSVPTGSIERLSLDGASAESIGAVDEGTCAAQLRPDHYVMWSQTIVRRADGKDQTLVAMTGCGLGPVGVRPGGRKLVFTAACDGPRSGLYIVPAEGGTPTQILDGSAYGAAWSPDGLWVATAQLDPKTDRYQLVVVHSDGTDRRVVPIDGTVNNPSWGPTLASA